MPTYRVSFREVNYGYSIVEAESEEDAEAMAMGSSMDVIEESEVDGFSVSKIGD